MDELTRVLTLAGIDRALEKSSELFHKAIDNTAEMTMTERLSIMSYALGYVEGMLRECRDVIDNTEGIT